mmetsp:Transcript_25655/g.54508  ORF Transcript_25655/g.54508 Transcript_25655/m.54508 type:complete len:88 (-) Transcript_25655:304-567(-)
MASAPSADSFDDISHELDELSNHRVNNNDADSNVSNKYDDAVDENGGADDDDDDDEGDGNASSSRCILGAGLMVGGGVSRPSHRVLA